MEIKKSSVSNGVKTKYFISSIAIIFTLFGIVLFSNNVFAQEQEGINDAGIQYPIAELGNCKSKEACATYCDKPKNEDACINFAEKNNMMSQKEIEVARNFKVAGSKGPGGCTSKNSCETYCNDIKRIDECVSFAEKNNLMPPAELAEAKQVQAAIARGVKPPPCGNKKQCDSYCEEPDHMEECINFGAEAGFMQGKDLEDAKKMLAAVKKGVKPPPCKGKDACDEYCSVPANMEVCMNFAVEAGFMSEDEKANSQKTLQAIKKGIMPPKCKGKEECDVYCGQEEHFEECVGFAEAAGFMSSEDAVMARKTGGKGPGGCKGKDECEAFCKNPDNQETCFNFAKDNGMIPEEELKKMEEGKARCAANPEECKNAGGFGPGGQRMGQGQPGPGGCKSPEECKAYCETHSEECQNFKPGPGQGGGPNDGQGMGIGQGQPGPGGCKSPEECKAYCQSNPEECQRFQPGSGAVNPGDQTLPQQAGPGGCKSPEECKTFCASNPEVCKNFLPGIPPQGQNNYPVPGQTQSPTCTGEACQSAPPEGMMPPTGSYPMPSSGSYPPSPSGSYPPPPPDGSGYMPGQTYSPTSSYMPPPPLNSPGYYQQPPANMQYQDGQQQPMQPYPGGNFPPPPPPPTSLNRNPLLAAISEIISWFLK